MDGSGSLQRLVARGLMLVAALVAVCAFHSSSEPASLPATPASSVPATVTVDMAGPFHFDLAGIASAHPTADHHVHLTVVSLLGFSMSLLLLVLASRARRTIAARPARTGWVFTLPDPAWRATPSLTQLRVCRR